MPNHNNRRTVLDNIFRRYNLAAQMSGWPTNRSKLDLKRVVNAVNNNNALGQVENASTAVEIATQTNNVGEIQNEIEETKEELKKATNNDEKNALRKELNALRKQLENEKEASKNLKAKANQEVQEARKMMNEAKAERNALQEQLGSVQSNAERNDLKRQIKAKNAEVKELKGELQGAKANAETAKTSANAAKANANASKANAKAAKAALANAEQRVRNAQNALKQAKNTNNKANLQTELNAAKAELNAAKAKAAANRTAKVGLRWSGKAKNRKIAKLQEKLNAKNAVAVNGEQKKNNGVLSNAVIKKLEGILERIREELGKNKKNETKTKLTNLQAEVQEAIETKKATDKQITDWLQLLQKLSDRAQVIIVWNRVKENKNAFKAEKNRINKFKGIEHIVVPEASSNSNNKIGDHAQPLADKIDALRAGVDQNNKNNKGNAKVNVLMMGPSGSGKTEIFRKLSGITPRSKVTAIYPVISVETEGSGQSGAMTATIVVKDNIEENITYAEFQEKFIRKTPLNPQSSRAHMYFDDDKGTRWFDLAGSESAEKLDNLFALACTGGSVKNGLTKPQLILDPSIIEGTLKTLKTRPINEGQPNKRTSNTLSSANFSEEVFQKFGPKAVKSRQMMWSGNTKDESGKEKCEPEWQGVPGFKERLARLVEALFIAPSNDELRDIFADALNKKNRKQVRIPKKLHTKLRQQPEWPAIQRPTNFTYKYTSTHIYEMLRQVSTNNLVVGTVLADPAGTVKDQKAGMEKKAIFDAFVDYLASFHTSATKNATNVTRNMTQQRRQIGNKPKGLLGRGVSTVKRGAKAAGRGLRAAASRLNRELTAVPNSYMR